MWGGKSVGVSGGEGWGRGGTSSVLGRMEGWFPFSDMFCIGGSFKNTNFYKGELK